MIKEIFFKIDLLSSRV